jgi:hypothetical protein
MIIYYVALLQSANTLHADLVLAHVPQELFLPVFRSMGTHILVKGNADRPMACCLSSSPPYIMT